MAESEGNGDRTVMSADELRERIAKNEAFVIDIQDADAFASRHVTGAENISEDELEERADDFAERELVVVVCEDGGRSERAAEQLRERGVEAVAMEDGMKAWAKEAFTQPSDDPD